MSPKPGEGQLPLSFEEPGTPVSPRGEALVTDGVSTAHAYQADPDAFGADWPSAVYNKRHMEAQAAQQSDSAEIATRYAMKEAVRAAYGGAERARQQLGNVDLRDTSNAPGDPAATRALRGIQVDARRRAASRGKKD